MPHTQPIDVQLARYLDQRPQDLDCAVAQATRARGVRWTPGLRGVTQWHGLEFLRPKGRLPAQWAAAWPPSVPPPTWDIMGRVQRGASSWERIFTWFVSSPMQLAGDCPTQLAVDSRRIHAFLDSAKEAFGVAAPADWVRGYYPVAQRLGVLGFLRSNGSCGRLLFVFVCGRGGNSPTEGQWCARLAEVDRHLGLSSDSILQRRVHRLFLPGI